MPLCVCAHTCVCGCVYSERYVVPRITSWKSGRNLQDQVQHLTCTHDQKSLILGYINETILCAICLFCQVCVHLQHTLLMKNSPHIHLKIYNSLKCWATAMKFHDFMTISFFQVLTKIKYVGRIMILQNCHKVNTTKSLLCWSHGWIFTYGAHHESVTM